VATVPSSAEAAADNMGDESVERQAGQSRQASKYKRRPI
jgi:hypothetical protein